MEDIFTLMYCGNPFNKRHHNPKERLRNVLPWMVEWSKNLRLDMKICSKCRRVLSKLRNSRRQVQTEEEQFEEMSYNQDIDMLPNENVVEFGKSTSSEPNYDLFINKSEILSYINKCCNLLGEQEFDSKRLTDAKYITEKSNRFGQLLCEKVFKIQLQKRKEDNRGMIFIEKLKEKYSQATNKETKWLILTLLPEDWNIPKIVSEFQGTTIYMARRSKQLIKEGGVLYLPSRKRRSVDLKIENVVKEFYNNNDNSRIMPGKKDYVSVKLNDKREHVQKRLILSNLKELHAEFKKCHPEIKVGFSKFASLRPKNCILAGATGTHAVCVCTLHQNIKLMIEGCKIRNLHSSDEQNIDFADYKSYLNMLICATPATNCYFKTCNNCPGTSHLRNMLENIFETNCIHTISYKQWTYTDRSNLETRIESTEDFIETFIHRLNALLEHSFITQQQSNYLKQLKSSLKSKEFIVLLDFSENYSFVLQDEAQAYHWNNTQATIHPFGIYFFDSSSQTLQHTNLVVISDCLKHTSVSVHLYQKKLIHFLKTKFGDINKIFYFSDGAPAQYKNKYNFCNISEHVSDFGFEGEWHFFATSHGKNICDGLGGTLKRLASKASLQRPYTDQITNPLRLYEWASQNCCSNFKFSQFLLKQKQKISIS